MTWDYKAQDYIPGVVVKVREQRQTGYNRGMWKIVTKIKKSNGSGTHAMGFRAVTVLQP